MTKTKKFPERNGPDRKVAYPKVELRVLFSGSAGSVSGVLLPPQ